MSLQVPDWLVGVERDVVAAIPRVASAWAASYRARGVFPAPTLVDAGSRDLVLYESSDFDWNRDAVRLFANGELVWEIERILQRDISDSLRFVYEDHVGVSAWGSFESFLFLRAPLSRARLAKRLQLVLPHLDELASVTVVAVGRERPRAAVLLDRWISATLVSWDAPETGPLPARVRAALATMTSEDDHAVRERIVRRMVHLAPTLPPPPRRNMFVPPPMAGARRLRADDVRDFLASLKADEYDDLTGCDQDQLLGATERVRAT